MVAALTHRHGRHVHTHLHDGPHRHLLRPRRSVALANGGGTHQHEHGHSHGLVDPSITRSREGLRAVSLSLLLLGATALAQVAVFIATDSVALLADLIHNFGDAATAIPLGVAFTLRSARAERWAGLAVVLAIFVSACVAGFEAVERLVNPQQPISSARSLWRAASASLATGPLRESGGAPAAGSTAPRSSPTETTPARTPT